MAVASVLDNTEREENLESYVFLLAILLSFGRNGKFGQISVLP